ncbi:CRISPR-associated endonuclease Cas2 [Aquifex aeolicus]|uniref:CRISPR-associated endonuclease Cas2 n=1 Tax=Aquifex aeolicus TaxID=63363 RepID=UPI0002F5CAD0|nr:CRISPR-associated endonuclease Cas2 [Aquifex aeolicus]
MKVILVYDVATDDKEGVKRLNKVRKIAKRYIHHVQKSVFEGEITLSRLERLKAELSDIIHKTKDSVIIYVFDDKTQYKREILTDTPDPTDNVI